MDSIRLLPTIDLPLLDPELRFEVLQLLLRLSVLATRLPRALTEHAAREGADAVSKFESLQKAAPKKKKNGVVP